MLAAPLSRANGRLTSARSQRLRPIADVGAFWRGSAATDDPSPYGSILSRTRIADAAPTIGNSRPLTSLDLSDTEIADAAPLSEAHGADLAQAWAARKSPGRGRQLARPPWR